METRQRAVWTACSYTMVLVISEWRSGAWDQNSGDRDRWLVEEPGVSVTTTKWQYLPHILQDILY